MKLIWNQNVSPAYKCATLFDRVVLTIEKNNWFIDGCASMWGKCKTEKQAIAEVKKIISKASQIKFKDVPEEKINEWECHTPEGYFLLILDDTDTKHWSVRCPGQEQFEPSVASGQAKILSAAKKAAEEAYKSHLSKPQKEKPKKRKSKK